MITSNCDRDALVVENLGLVWHIARRLRPVPGIELNDLVQVGLQGMLRAARRFDPARGPQFTSYGGLAAQRAMARFRRQHRSVIPLPDQMPASLREQSARAVNVISLRFPRDGTRGLSLDTAVDGRTVKDVDRRLDCEWIPKFRN